MSLPRLISNCAAFNEWANHRIVDWLQSIDRQILYRETPSSFTTIDYTLQHILRTQRYWLLFISGKDTSDFDWAVREHEVDNILSELKTVSTQMKEVFSSFSESELLETLHYDMPWAKNDLSRYEYIMHIINHGTFHRGQIVTMARCLGLTEGIVNTDYNIFNSR
jgi:uncharacterized damage-inducible protein DinB